MVKVNYTRTLAKVGLKDDTYSQEGQSEFAHLLYKDSSCVGSDIGNCRQLKREYLPYVYMYGKRLQLCRQAECRRR